MFLSMIQSMLGPSGTAVLNWYAANSLYVNGVIVLVAIIAIFAPRRSKKIQEKLAAFWAKTPFALEEKDRIAVEKNRARMAAMRYAPKSRRTK